MANLVGLGGSESKRKAADNNATKKTTQTRRAAVVPEPSPKPAASKPQAVANAAPHGAIRPKPEAEPRRETPNNAEAPPPAPSPWPAVTTPAAAAQSQPPASTAMNGAARVVPAGSFENRWSAFR
jgi:hypothetical protein